MFEVKADLGWRFHKLSFRYDSLTMFLTPHSKREKLLKLCEVDPSLFLFYFYRLLGNVEELLSLWKAVKFFTSMGVCDSVETRVFFKHFLRMNALEEIHLKL